MTGKSESVMAHHYVNKDTKEVSPSVVLIVVIKLIVDIYWSFHMLVDLQREICVKFRVNLSKIRGKKPNVW